MLYPAPEEHASRTNDPPAPKRGTLPRALYEFKKEFCDVCGHDHIDEKDVAACARAVIAIEELRIHHERGLLPRFVLGSIASRILDADETTNSTVA